MYKLYVKHRFYNKAKHTGKNKAGQVSNVMTSKMTLLFYVVALGCNAFLVALNPLIKHVPVPYLVECGNYPLNCET